MGYPGLQGLLERFGLHPLSLGGDGGTEAVLKLLAVPLRRHPHLRPAERASISEEDKTRGDRADPISTARVVAALLCLQSHLQFPF